MGMSNTQPTKSGHKRIKKHQIVGGILILAGCGIIIIPQFQSATTSLPSPPLTAEQKQWISQQQEPANTLPATEQAGHPAGALEPLLAMASPAVDSALVDYLADRALREAEAAAQRAALQLMQAITQPLQNDGEAFAEALYSIGANAKSLYQNETDYRNYVAGRFKEELEQRSELQDTLDAILFEYTHRLDRIANQIAIESGLDVPTLPTVTLDFNDFEQFVNQDIRATIAGTADSIEKQTRQGATIEVVSIGIGLLMPTPLLLDLAIGLAIGAAADTFRDPVGQVQMDAQHSAELLAERICFGTSEQDGLYGVLLGIAACQSRQLRETLMQAKPFSNDLGLELVFGGGDE